MVSTALHVPPSWSITHPAGWSITSLCVSAGVLEWPFWTKLIVVAIGFTGGLIFMYIQCKVYLQLWRRLKAFNRIITVQNCPEKGLHNSQAQTNALTNGRHETVDVPVSPAPALAPDPQMDSDMSVEAAVAPSRNPVWLILLPHKGKVSWITPCSSDNTRFCGHGVIRLVQCFSVVHVSSCDYWTWGAKDDLSASVIEENWKAEGLQCMCKVRKRPGNGWKRWGDVKENKAISRRGLYRL